MRHKRLRVRIFGYALSVPIAQKRGLEWSGLTKFNPRSHMAATHSTVPWYGLSEETDDTATAVSMLAAIKINPTFQLVESQ